MGSAAAKNRAHGRRFEGASLQTRKGRRKRRPFVSKPLARDARREQAASDFLELIGGGLAGALVLRDLVAHLLAFAEITQAGALDRADIPQLVENPGEFPCILRLNGFG